MSQIIGSVNDPGITSTPPTVGSAPMPTLPDGIIGSVGDAGIQTQEEHFGTTGEQIKAGLEGVAQGVIGPLAPAIERGFGVDPQDINARAAANPVTHGLGEAAGFVGSALTGVGEAGLIANVGEHAASLLPEATGAVAKLVSTGVKTGAEMAALQTSDELSKVVTQDPNQTVQSAAINIGLSGILGGAGGAVLGSVGQLWNKTANKLGVEKLANDFMGETQAIRNAGADPVATTTAELQGRMDAADAMRTTLSETKPEVLAQAMPEVTAQNTAKIDEQISSVVKSIDSKIKSITESNDPYLKSAISKLEFHKQQLLDATDEGFNRSRPVEISPEIPKVAQEEVRATPIRFDENPARRAFPWLSEKDAPPTLVRGEEQAVQSRMLNANPQEAVRYTPLQRNTVSYVQKFKALDDLKSDLQGLVNYARNSSEDTALGGVAKDFAAKIRTGLEDRKVWGAAGDVQRVTNEATSNLIKATKDFRGQVTTNTMGENQIDPAKVQTLLNQTNAGKISRKANVVGNYLDATQKQADAINQVHLDNGLEAPLSSKLNPTPTLDHALNTPITPGVTLARWANRNGSSVLANAAGETGAGLVGGGLGALVGHPLVGAWMGEKVLSPIFSALAKPLAENAVNATAAKASVDYLGQVIKGTRALSTATSNLLKPGVQVLAKDLIPDQESRDRLQKSLDNVQNPQNMIQVGGQIGHYLPQHATAAASVAAVASQYLNSLKPKQPVQNGFDTPPPIDKAQQAKYNRQLDIAQQPLMVLQHVKNATLLPQDVQTLHTIYPNLHSQMVSQISNELIKAKTDGVLIPYSQRVSLSMLLGTPIGSTMTPQSMQAIMRSSMTQQAQQQNQPGKEKPATGVALKQINKTNSLYATNLESLQERKRS